LERIRAVKRELGLPEGPLERLIPVRATKAEVREVRTRLLRVIQGVAYGKEAGVWYRVTFPGPVYNPQVVAVAEGRPTSMITRTIPKVPDVSARKVVKPPDVAFRTIPRVVATREDIEREIKRRLGDWGYFNWIRNSIAKGLSYVFKWIFDVIVGAQMDRVQSEINKAIRDINTKTNMQFSRLVDSINSTISDFNVKVNRQVDRITDRVNMVLRDLYRMWGIPEGTAIQPVHIRNVNEKGFEFLSLGDMKVRWIAIGERR